MIYKTGKRIVTTRDYTVCKGVRGGDGKAGMGTEYSSENLIKYFKN